MKKSIMKEIARTLSDTPPSVPEHKNEKPDSPRVKKFKAIETRIKSKMSGKQALASALGDNPPEVPGSSRDSGHKKAKPIKGDASNHLAKILSRKRVEDIPKIESKTSHVSKKELAKMEKAMAEQKKSTPPPTQAKHRKRPLKKKNVIAKLKPIKLKSRKMSKASFVDMLREEKNKSRSSHQYGSGGMGGSGMTKGSNLLKK